MCHREGEAFDCINHLLPGTKATIYCHSGYKRPPTGFNLELTCLVRRYEGFAAYWRADICVVVIKKFFEYKHHIAPACVKFAENGSEKYPKDGSRALVAGWGLTKVSFSKAFLFHKFV